MRIMASYTSHFSKISTFKRKRRKFELLVCGFARLQSEQFNLNMHMVLIPLINLFVDSVFWWHLKTDQLKGLIANEAIPLPPLSSIAESVSTLSTEIKSEPFKISNGFVFQFYLYPNLVSHDNKFIGFYWKIKSFPSLLQIKELMMEELIRRQTRNIDIAMIEPAKIDIHFTMSCKQIKSWNVECRASLDIKDNKDIKKDISQQKIGWKWYRSKEFETKLETMPYLSFGCDIIKILIHQKENDECNMRNNIIPNEYVTF